MIPSSSSTPPSMPVGMISVRSDGIARVPDARCVMPLSGHHGRVLAAPSPAHGQGEDHATDILSCAQSVQFDQFEYFIHMSPS